MKKRFESHKRQFGHLSVGVALVLATLPILTYSGIVRAVAGFGNSNVVSTAAFGAESVTAADLDGDGDIDLASASFTDDKIAWYRNDGAGAFTEFTVTTTANGAQSVTAADLDGDGDIDLVSASLLDDKIAWYQNNGSGSFTAVTIATTADGASEVTAADLDGDGDIDLASASRYDDTIAWYENNGVGGFTATDIVTNADVASSVTAADLDGDGDIDLASASYVDDKIAWYRNDGPGLFTQITISTAADGARSVTAADLDGDGDIDLASASYVDDKVAWYENNGAGIFTTTTIATISDGATSVVAADLDGDSDIDLASTGFNGSSLEWYENDGTGTFSSNVITSSAAGATSVTAADLDGDGDADLASASYFDDTIAWYENSIGVNAGGPYEVADGASIVLAATTNAPSGTTLTVTWDFDNDGSYDDATGLTPTFDTTVFGAIGTNPIAAWATDGGALTASDTTTLKITVDPVVDAGGPYTVDASTTIALAATTDDPDGGTPTLLWDLDGDGQYDDAAGASPTFDPATFGSPGPNTIAVQATDDEAVTVTDTTTITITTDPLVTTGGPYATAPGTTIMLTATTSDPDGGTSTLTWDFDDDGQFDDAVGLTPTFDTNLFGAIGPNPVSAMAIDDEAATTVAITSVKITADPVVDAGGPYVVSVGGTSSLSATGSDPDGGTATLAWDFDGDGSFDDATGLSPTFDPGVFGSLGANTISVRVTDDESVTAVDTATVTITTSPIVDPGGPYTVDSGGTVPFTATTSDPDGGTATLAWDFDGDGSFDDATGLTPTFDAAVFGSPGVNTISVRATDDEFDTTDDTVTLTIAADPVVDAGGPYVVSVGGTTSLSATGSDPDGGAATLAWDFDGDGSFDDATGLTPTFDPGVFGSLGANTISVRVTDDESVTAVDTATVTITTSPIVDAGGPYNVSVASTVTLSASASDPDGGTPVLSWDFDNDGQFDDATGLTPTFDAAVFGSPGVNTISVQATDDEGDVAVDAAAVTIATNPAVGPLSDPVVDAGGPYTVNIGNSVTLSASASDPDGGTPVLSWDFDNDGQFDDATGLAPTFDSVLFGSPGVNIISVQATDDQGAIAVDVAEIVLAIVGGATFDPGSVTSLDPERFVDTRSNGITLDQQFQADGVRLGQSSYRVEIAGRGSVPIDATAIVANITAVRPAGNGFITAHPCLTPRPLSSSLNYTENVNLGNEVVIPLTASGELCLYTHAGTHITIDVSGYLDAQSPIQLISPARFLDTRPTGETIDGLAEARGRVNAGTTYRLDVAGRDRIPSDATAVIVNVTAVGAKSNGYITVHACLETTPNAASLNYVSGVNRGNEIVAQLDANGDLCLYTHADIHLTADISGYLMSESGVVPIGPARFVDTRATGVTVDGFDQAIGKIDGGNQLRIQVAGREGIPADAETVELNVTAVRAEARGYITIHPCLSPRPNVASLNFATGVNGGNAIITSLDHTGHLCIFASSTTHITVDVTNHISPS